MDDRLSRLESRVEELSRALSDLDRRLSELEAEKGTVAAETSPAAEPAAEPVERDSAAALSLVGRTFLTFAGAYLLRAITEGGALPRAVGVSIGLGYALAWIVLADRSAAAGKKTSASFHGAAAALIGYPILWETTVRLQLVGAFSSAALVVAFSLALLTVVWRRSLTSTAWVVQFGVVVTAFGLMGGTHAVVPYAGALVAVGVATLWLGYRRAWPSLQWFSATVADLAVMLVTLGTFAQRETIPVTLALSVQLFLFLAYFASCYLRTETEHRPANLFEIVQSSAATFVGLGSALVVADTPFTLGLASLLGAGIALVAIRRALHDWHRPELGGNGALFSSLAVASLLLSTSASIPGAAYLWSALGVMAFVFGSRLTQITLSLHGGVLLLAASAASGLLTRAAFAFAAPASATWPPFSFGDLVVIAAAFAGCLATIPEARPWGAWRRMPKALALLASVAGCGVVAMYLLGPPLAGVSRAAVDPAVLASLRTAVLAVAAIALGALAGRKGLREALWLLYPLLFFSGIKLILEDFPEGRAETLFVGLGCYGCALIVAPRLARRRR